MKKNTFFARAKYNTPMSIHLLPPEVASQIAAGEVIERPASVVKELLENALDAGARQIVIRIAGAGQRLVEVADDGSGIPADELPLALERHATSKLQSASDLFSIATLGFRGEALASIGSVARLTLTSRPPQAEVGARLYVEGGRVGAVEPVGAPPGTVVRVEDLFYNLPVRLKFLKADATERRQIDNLVTRYALAYPHVRFHLYQDGRPALQTTGSGQRREVLAALLGAEVARQMIEVISQEETCAIKGFISPASQTRSNRREITFFVNGRPVQDAALSSAVLQAYHTLLMVGRYPVAALLIELPPDAVDVNVHPTKAEVRFRDADRLFSAVQRAVRRALLAHTPVPDLASGMNWTQPASPSPELDNAERSRASALIQSTQPTQPNRGDAMPEYPPEPEEPPPPEETFPLEEPEPAIPPQPALSAHLAAPVLRLVGQIAATYLAAEGPDGLYLIDQHAAHERVLFEQMLAQHGRSAASQGLLAPVVVHLPAASARLIEGQLPLLEHLGFVVEPFGQAAGQQAFLVRALPQILARMDASAALRALVEDFEEDETPLQEEFEDRMIARICKRAAVKAGQTLSPEEQRALLDQLQACRAPRTCPHGRPTMIHLSVDLLERQFGRKGAR